MTGADYLIWLAAPACQAAVLFKMWGSGMHRRFPVLFAHQAFALCSFVTKLATFHIAHAASYFWAYQLSNTGFLVLSCWLQYSILASTDGANDRLLLRQPSMFLCVVTIGGTWSFLAAVIRGSDSLRDTLMSALMINNQFFRCMLLLLCLRFVWWLRHKRVQFFNTYSFVSASVTLIAISNLITDLFGITHDQLPSTALRIIFDVAEGGIIAAVYWAPEYVPVQVGLMKDLMIRNFRVIEQISLGAAGLVFEAEDLELNRNVALKLLSPSSVQDPKQSKMFHREARVLAALDHPHICKAFSAFEINGQRVLVMELLVGEPLTAHLPWDGTQVHLVHLLRLLCQAADAIAYAHARGVLHNDIHAENLFVTEFGLKIVDFGLCRFANEVERSDMVDATLQELDVLQLASLMHSAIAQRRILAPEMRLNHPFHELRRLSIRATNNKDRSGRMSALELRDNLLRILEQMSPDRSLPPRYSPEPIEETAGEKL